MGGWTEVTDDPAALRPSVVAGGATKRATATYFVLYLNDQTYLHEAGAKLADDLRTARAEGSTNEIVMVHENDQQRGGCTFGTFFDGRTPEDLLIDGLYKALAVALYPGAFWPVSVALVARAMGATKARGGFITALAQRGIGSATDAGAAVKQSGRVKSGRLGSGKHLDKPADEVRV